MPKKSANHFLTSIRSNMLTGAFILAPMAAVFWITAWLWNILSTLVDLIPSALLPHTYLATQHPFVVSAFDFLMTVLMLALVIVFIAWVGFISRNYLGRKALSFIRKALSRVPVLSTVYSTLEQLFETFAGNKKESFHSVALVEFPRKGVKTLALVTGTRKVGAKSMVTVYVPTTPNPTGGYYLMLEKDDVEEIDMTVEEALKEIISMGLVKAGK